MRLMDRDDLLEEIVTALVSGRHRVITLVPELDGVEGFGTTTLAAVACRRSEVRDRFGGEIEWVTLGNDPVQVLDHRLTTRLGLAAELKVRDFLAMAVPQRIRPARRLVVLDEVRPETGELVVRVAASNAVVVVTGARAPAGGLVFKLPSISSEAGDRSQGWPLLRTLMRSLDAVPDEPFDLADAGQRARAVHQVLDHGLTRTLASADLERLLELGGFKGSRPIPLDLAALLWWETAGLSRAESERLLAELGALGLVTRAPDRDVILMPGAVRDYLRAVMGTVRVQQADRAMVEIGEPREDWSEEAGVYFYEYFADHLEAAGGDLGDLVLAGSWLATRLVQAGPRAVARELSRAGTQETELLRRALEQNLHLLGEPPYTDLSVLATLACRVHYLPEIAGQLRDVLNDMAVPWLECLWTSPDLPHPSLRLSWTVQEGEATSVAISPDGTWLVIGGEDGPVRLWNRDGSVRTELAGDFGQVSRVAIAPDGTWLATAVNGGGVRLWSADGEPLREVGDYETGQDVVIAPDGTWLAALSLYGGLTAWTAQGRELWHVDAQSDDAELSTLAIAADGSWLAHAVGDRIHVRNADGTLRAGIPHAVQGITLAAHPTRDALVTSDGAVYGPDGELLQRIPIEHWSYAPLAVAPDGTWLATASRGDDVLVARLDRPATHHLLGHDDEVQGVAISPDGTWLASVSADGTACVWEHEDLPRLDGQSPPGSQGAVVVAPNGSLATAGAELVYWDEAGNPLFSVSGLVSHMRLAACQSWLVAWDHQNQLWLIDREGNVRERLETHHSRPLALAAAPDSTWFATSGAEGDINLWSHDGIVIRRLRSDIGPARHLAISADSRTLIAASDTAVRRWTKQGRQIGRSWRMNSPIKDLATSPDGSRTAVILASGAIRQWDDRYRKLPGLQGLANYAATLAYSPTGALLAATYASTLQVWDAAAGQPMARIRLGATLRGCAWSPDGTRVYVTGDAGLHGFTLHVPSGN
ncbi:hypothetical protein [Nonomuraea sp. NPDC049709]|uniref:hypothetical protein n=1 Tax=Nonomuraea sp. NPDC049709 TaxID=3154736 RepID=UPI00342D2EF1